MDGVDRTIMRRKSLKERLGLKSIGCCGSQFPTTVSVRDEEEEEEAAPIDLSEIEIIDDNNNRGSSRGMNLAAALAAERELRAALESESPPNEVAISTSSRSSGTVPGTPARVSLMRLLEEADGGVKRRKEDDEEEEGGGLGGCDSVCCVCMGRKKGAAFIPCGHTFCRVCSREVWLNRGSCPLCNRFILEILDIY